MPVPTGSAIVLDVQEVRLEDQGEEVGEARVQKDRLENQDEDVGQREEEERGQPAAGQVHSKRKCYAG